MMKVEFINKAVHLAIGVNMDGIKEVAKDLKSIYSAINEKHAKENLEEFKKRWNNKLNSSTKCNKSYNF